MSCTEFHKGKAKEIQFPEGFTLKEKVQKMKLDGIEFECEDYNDKDFEGNFIFLRNHERFFEVIEHFQVQDEDQDISEVKQNQDGTIDFMFHFYNGGTGFNEVFEEVIGEISPPVPLTEEQIESNILAQNILENEGSGYAVTSHSRGEDYLDPETSRLWDEAGKALENLEKYLEQYQ